MACLTIHLELLSYEVVSCVLEAKYCVEYMSPYALIIIVVYLILTH